MCVCLECKDKAVQHIIGTNPTMTGAPLESLALRLPEYELILVIIIHSSSLSGTR